MGNLINPTGDHMTMHHTGGKMCRVYKGLTAANVVLIIMVLLLSIVH